MGPKEVEVALVLFSPDAERILSKVNEALASVSTAELDRSPPRKISIEDVYFDTYGRTLQNHALALRLREIRDGRGRREMKITLKGPSRFEESNRYLERLEIEKDWSTQSLNEVVTVLATMGVEVPRGKVDGHGGDFVDAMRRLGWQVIQRRTSDRTITGAVSRKKGVVVAELAIDHVTYHFARHRPGYWCLEIEEKRRGYSSFLKKLLKELEVRFGKSAERWDYGKLATGKAIEILIEGRKENLGNLVDSNQMVRRRGFERIERVLRSRRLMGSYTPLFTD